MASIPRYLARMEQDKTQLDKFKEAARQLETDDNDERFEERLKKLVKQKPNGKLDESEK